MSTATAGRAREYQVRDHLAGLGWEPVMRAKEADPRPANWQQLVDAADAQHLEHAEVGGWITEDGARRLAHYRAHGVMPRERTAGATA